MKFSRKQQQALDESTRLLLGPTQAPLPENEFGRRVGVGLFKMVGDISQNVGLMDSSKRSPAEVEVYLVQCVNGGLVKDFISHPHDPALGASDSIRLEILIDPLRAHLTHLAKEMCEA